VQLDAYRDGKIDQLFVLTTRFINTMKQEPTALQLLPLHFAQPVIGEIVDTAMARATRGTTSTSRTRRKCSTACSRATSRR
jgi:hypothetical protein